MKVCLVAPVPPPYGGIGNWVLLMKKYVSTRTDVQLSYLNTAPVGRSIDGRTLFQRVVVQGFKMLAGRRELKKLIKNDRPDVIHMTTSGQLAAIRDIMLLKTAKRKGVPTVYHIRFGRIAEIAKNDTREWHLMRKAISLATVTMVLDSNTYSAIEQYVPQAKVVRVPNPIDLTALPQKSQEIQKTVMYLGWVIPTKGIDELVKAWNVVGSEFPDYTLKVVGPYKEDYFESVKGLCKAENIDFTGEMKHDEAMKLMSKCSVFVLPSYTEGFPNVIIEAMCLEKPVVATRVGAIEDMLADDCGVLIDKQDEKQLEDALRQLLSNEQTRNEMGERAEKKAVENYCVDRVFDKYMECWKSITK